MNVYDYRTIPPEESTYHARTGNTAEYGDDDIPEADLPKDENNSSASEIKDVIPDEVPRRDGPGGN